MGHTQSDLRDPISGQLMESEPAETQRQSVNFNAQRHRETFGDESDFARNKRRHMEMFNSKVTLPKA